MSARIKGRDLLLFNCDKAGKMGDSAFACSQSCDININAVYEEVSDKDTATTPEQELTRVDWDISTNTLLSTVNGLDPAIGNIETLKQGADIYVAFGFKSGDVSSLAKAVEDQSGKKWVSDGAKKYLFGKCKIESVSISAPHDGKTTVSIKLKGSGELKVGTASLG